VYVAVDGSEDTFSSVGELENVVEASVLPDPSFTFKLTEWVNDGEVTPRPRTSPAVPLNVTYPLSPDPVNDTVTDEPPTSIDV
jgi:hypothetical protein